ncbi:MAG: NUDIX hydrolase [bacterium]|nr:NUDIX hydrolase [bacterium]
MAEETQQEHAARLERWAKEGRTGLPPILAATVILLRDGPTGLETLMLKRNSKIVFGGMWVFPGGRLDDADWSGVPAGDELAASRQAASREAMEESGLAVEVDSMVPFSHWTPPPIQPKRFLTWFFAARAGSGEVAIDDGEIKQSEWLSPRAALERQATKEIELAPPTFVTLMDLMAFDAVDSALAAAADRTPERYATKIGVLDGVGPVSIWHGDAGYAEGNPHVTGPRHRLTMAKGGPWTFERSR